jgi:hypothetical protein
MFFPRAYHEKIQTPFQSAVARVVPHSIVVPLEKHVVFPRGCWIMGRRGQSNGEVAVMICHRSLFHGCDGYASWALTASIRTSHWFSIPEVERGKYVKFQTYKVVPPQQQFGAYRSPLPPLATFARWRFPKLGVPWNLSILGYLHLWSTYKGVPHSKKMCIDHHYPMATSPYLPEIYRNPS